MSPSSSMVTRRRSAVGACALAVTAALLASLGIAAPAVAAPPTTALVAPADGSTATASAPALSVAVSDPDGDPLEVTFEGRVKGATVPVPSTAEPFTLAAIPDIQNYTNASRAPIIAQQAQWIVDTRAQLNTQFAVQLGDLVGTWSWSGHWPFASNGMKVLDDSGMPNAVVPGNHDFDYANDDHSQYDTWFPPSRYQNATWTPSTARYGGYMGQNQFGPDASDRANMNNYSLFTAGGVDWLVLGLEWEAPTPVLEWADRVLAAHPDRQVIMFTHAFLDLPGTRRTTPERPGGTTPEVMWQNFVRTHCQIRLVLNGHENDGDLGEANRTDANACGQPVHQILSDYQARANGGDGWLRYYRFDPAAATMTAVTYSPYLDRYETDADSSFTLPFSMTPAQPAPFTPIATVSAASGSTATTTWQGRTADTAYEWRVRVSDGTTTETSPAWTVRTPGEAGVLGRDLFERAVASGWGTADAGGPWTTTAPARFRVAGGTGLLTLTTSTGLQANLPSVSSTRTRISAVLSVDKIADAHYIMLIGRQVGSEQYLLRLRVAANGSAMLHVLRGGTAIGAAYTVPGVTIVPGVKYHVVFDVTGTSPTTLAAKLWRAGTTEPAAWQLTRTDSTAALQTAGTVGIHSRVSSAANAFPLTVAFDEIRVVDPTVTGLPPPPPPPPPPNQSPVAAFTSTPTGLAVSVDGRGSTDADGTVASYAWSFGDGTTATGAQASRTYAAAGTYTVTLTVTDDDGAVDVETAQVTVTAPP
ncbi:PKD domain-containing protein, partial [Planococcus sp. APC 4015]|nr:PKD domain-containing protein [Planococcus sp. APC 4015]